MYKSITSDMEDLIMDFLLYRKTKAQGIRTQSGFDSGMSHQRPLIPEESMPKNHEDYSAYSRRYPKHDSGKEGTAVKALNTEQKDVEIIHKENGLYPNPEQLQFFYGETQKDMELMLKLHCEINTKLVVCVDEVLNGYEYMGSPVSGERVTSETLNEIVDKVLKMACEQIEEAKKIMDEPDGSGWCRKRLLRSCAEALVLCELYGRRRPMYRSIFGSSYEYFS